ncbi:MAG: aspartate/glutamate racemase family protein [Erysipelotrichaceae bacterium]|nr:aspartate/glutamate racemase family protein [Erysipelotrichaceae bacterium]
MNAIGIVDSGLGGYTVYESLRQAYPDASFVFLADQKHAPYGNKSPEEIIAISYQNMMWFYDQGIREVILACNTASSVALEFIRPIFSEMQIHGIIDLTVEHIDLKKDDKVLILATQATINSGSYPDSIGFIEPDVKVDGIAMVDLVKHVESLSDEATVTAYLKKEFAKKTGNYSKVVLACTHYPIVKDLIAKELKGELYDSRQAIVDLLKDRDLPQGESRCYTTGNPDHAKLQVKTLFSHDQAFLKAVTEGMSSWK